MRDYQPYAIDRREDLNSYHGPAVLITRDVTAESAVSLCIRRWQDIEYGVFAEVGPEPLWRL